MDKDWNDWVALNLKRKCLPAGIKQILVKKGFSPDEIKAAMGEEYPEDTVRIDHKRLSEVRITKPESGAVKFRSDKIQLYTLRRFLSEKQCDRMVELIDQRLRPSTLTVQSSDSNFRTSSTCDLMLVEDPLVSFVDRKIARTLGINRSFSEGIQAQKYLPGQQFKSHTDFFEPGTKEYEQHAHQTGNRTWTFMIYLTEVIEGGGTAFKMIGKTFYPKKGMAVIWNNLSPDGSVNRHTLHSGEPVIGGEKVIITKWFREKGAGEMFNTNS